MLRALLLLPLLLTAGISAQTIGVSGVNDLEVILAPSVPLPAGSSTTSCFVIPGGNHSCINAGVLQYRVSANATSVASLLFLSLCSPCGGANNIPFAFAPCSGGAGGFCTAGNPGTNRCFSLNLGVGCSFNAWMISAGAGFHHLRIPIPPATCFGNTVWAQAVIVDPCAPGGFHLTQALGIN
jgi:hypothetical protein